MKLKLIATLLFLTLASAFIYLVFEGNYFSLNITSSVPVNQQSPTSQEVLNKLYTSQLRDYRGEAVSIDKDALGDQQSVIIHLWASWCGPCIGEVPELIEFSKKNPDVKFVIISLDETKEDIAKFLKSFPEFNSEKYIKIWDGPSALSSFLNADRLPMSIIISKNKSEPQFVKSVMDWKNFRL